MKSKALRIRSLPRMTESWAKRCHVSGRSSALRARHRALRVGLLGLLLVVGCGAGRFDPNNVTVNISPAAATIPESGQVKLQLTVHGNCAGCVPFYNWLVSENNGTNCTWVDTPTTGPCPGGTLQESTSLSGPAVTYLAPDTPGAFHAIGQALYYSNLGSATTVKQATSVITVNP
jgi:hypothetical protein